jgi:hypothetical protein
MRYCVRAKHGKRSRTFYVDAASIGQAKADASHLIVHHYRNAKGYTGEVWQRGTVTIVDYYGTKHEVETPPHLFVV